MSGFLVGGKAIERLQQGVFDIKGYAIDRTVRIMLPLISALLLFIPVAIIQGFCIDWKAWLGNLFSLQGIFDNLYYTYFKAHYFESQQQFFAFFPIIVPLVFFSSFGVAWLREKVNWGIKKIL